MRKTLHNVYFALFAVLLAAGLVACGTEPDEPIEIYVRQTETENHANEWTIEELGQVIVSAGNLWEDWWNLDGRFAHIDFVDLPEGLEHRGMGMSVLLPASGFQSLDDIRDYLLQFYTPTWVDAELSGDFSVFVEYDGVLYADGTRAGFARPRWDDATHVLIEQDGNRAVVETTFLHGAWHRGEDYAYPSKVTYRFTLIDGKIDIGLGPWAHSDDMVFEALPLNVAQFGRIIEFEGRFWEAWWNFHLDFDWQNNIGFDQDLFYETEDAVYVRLLPQSGFETLDHIRNRLSWNTTDNWAEQLLTSEHPPFIEHNGQLYINMTRQPGLHRPDWSTARHVLVEQDGQHAVVETTVYLTPFVDFENPADGSAGELTLRFTFMEGRIDASPGFPMLAE